jgi:hypothetical protein
MRIKKVTEFIDNSLIKDLDLDLNASKEIYKTYSQEFKKTKDIWQALEDTSKILNMSENDIYLHIANMGEGSLFL